MNTIALSLLVSVAIGGVLWVFIYPILSGARRAEQRQKLVMETTPIVRGSAIRSQQKSRREQVEGSLKDLEARKAKKISVPLSQRISQAGLALSKNQFYFISAVLGVSGFSIFSIINIGVPFA